ncbi:glucokinase [Sanguibacter gelidistatuariae]|uniref:Glucokinase n=1 Tax=Sanguibacter gelidistatuariae TaxID=1814289 RepID=A0A1G6HDP3_9MICO|nr:ROK family protein [Sanguibacter gelidistatuariae]SDB92264.1 glucokinase [Sanguibacter gelidistatuariae]
MTAVRRIGLDIGGTKMLALLADETGQILARSETATPSRSGPRAILDAAARIVREVAGPGLIARVGVGTAGIVDHRTGTILSATDALPGWAGTEVALELSALLDGALVSVVNDVVAFSIGEGRFGAAAGYDSFVAVTVGTGVGGAVVVDGTPLVGAHHLAGHVGHMAVPQAGDRACPCGRKGHVESIASGTAMVETYRLAGGHADTLVDVAAALRAGDERAADAVRLAGQGLGTALASLANAVDPRVIVVGGGALNVGELLLAQTRTAFAQTALEPLVGVEIRPALLPGHAVALGATLLGEARAPGIPALPRRPSRTDRLTPDPNHSSRGDS